MIILTDQWNLLLYVDDLYNGLDLSEFFFYKILLTTFNSRTAGMTAPFVYVSKLVVGLSITAQIFIIIGGSINDCQTCAAIPANFNMLGRYCITHLFL